MPALSLDRTTASVAAELAGAADLFRRWGISFCCDGDVSLLEAAEQAGLPPEGFIAELEALERNARRDAPDETRSLIDHLLTRYYETHRRELDFLIPLAGKVSRVHRNHPAAPIELAETLESLRDKLEMHMKKGELVLFPMMRAGGNETIMRQITQMRREHGEIAQLLSTIEQVTCGLAPPASACGSWSALYIGVKKLKDDLVAHMHIESAILFPRFEQAPAAAEA